MADDNGGAPDAPMEIPELEALLAPVEAELEKTEAEIEEHETAIAPLKEKRRRLYEASKKLKGIRKAPPTTQSAVSDVDYVPSDEDLERVRKVVNRRPAGAMLTQTNVERDVDGMGGEKVGKILNYMRGREEIRRHGRIKGGGTGYKRILA